jgi:hypothetical protein
MLIVARRRQDGQDIRKSLPFHFRFFTYSFTHVFHSHSTSSIARLVGLGLDMGWTAFTTRSFAFHALDIIRHSPLRLPCTMRRLRDIRDIRAYHATSAHLRRLKRECSRALCSTVAPYLHHPSSIVMSSLRPYILLKLHHRSILHSRTSAS